MATRLTFCWCLTAVLLVAGCGAKEQTVGRTGAAVRQEPEYITVQHILIGFEGSVPGKTITRSKEAAERLAEEVLRRAEAGEDFDELVTRYTDDQDPGVYGLANHGAEPDRIRQIHARSEMARAFGDVGFSLAVGEIGMARYHKKHCPYGWHIIKRLR